MRFIPERTPSGGSLFGNSYTASFAKCPRQWFNSYKRPLDASMGIKSRFTSEHLIKGRVFHVGIAELYQTGCTDGTYHGEWNIDQAMARMELEHTVASIEYESEEKADEDWLLLQSMLLNYHDEFSKNGNRPEFPEIRVLFDGKGQPMIEREFQVDLGYRDYVLTSRIDLLIEHHAFPKAMEHKTSAPGFWATKRLNSIHTDSQATTECFVLAALFPEERINEVYYNIVIKKGRSEIAKRDTTRRDYHDLNTFRLATIDILEQIDRRTEGFDNDRDSGLNEEEAADRWFPDHGTRTGACEEYGGCQFQTICRNKDRIEQNLKSFRPRTVAEVTESMERPR